MTNDTAGPAPFNPEPLNRRNFLVRAAVCALATSIVGEPIMADNAGQTLQRIGVQLYTLRDPLAEDFAGTLRKVAAMGYRELEFAGYHDQDPGQIARLLTELGMTAPSAHIPIDMLGDQLERWLELAHLMGHRYLVVPWLAPDQRESLDQYRAHAELFNRAGEQCRKAGIKLAYHNHDFEFEVLDGSLPYDLLLEATDPALVSMELDLYWISKAGHDPLQYFAGHPRRFSLCHVKDMAADGAIADVGRGELDFRRLLAAARSAGVQHYYVENDQPQDPLQSVQFSYRTLAALAF
jgi:sugar phosphate isomerase/epimerase